MHLVRLTADCDGDTLLVEVDPAAEGAARGEGLLLMIMLAPF